MTKKRLKYKVCVCDVVMVQMRAENSIYKAIVYQGHKTIYKYEINTMIYPILIHEKDIRK